MLLNPEKYAFLCACPFNRIEIKKSENRNTGPDRAADTLLKNREIPYIQTYFFLILYKKTKKKYSQNSITLHDKVKKNSKNTLNYRVCEKWLKKYAIKIGIF